MSDRTGWREFAKPTIDDPDGIYIKPHYAWGEMWVKIGPLILWAEMSNAEHVAALDQSWLDVYEARSDYRRRNPWRYVCIQEVGDQ